MKSPLSYRALIATALSFGLTARGNDQNGGSYLVPNPHGGYNVTQASGPVATGSLFGPHNSNNAYLVQNPHGGYNVAQAGGPPASVPFFGAQGFAHMIAARPQGKPKFILVPFAEDDGHGNKHVVYKKIRFATAEQAEAAKDRQ